MLKRDLPTILCLVLAGCASSNTNTVPASSTQVQQVVVEANDGGVHNVVTMNRVDNAYSADLKSSPSALWPALVAVMNGLQLPGLNVDSTHYLIGAPSQRVRRIQGKPIAYYVDCPGTAYGNSAEAGDVYATVQSQLLPKASGSELRVTFQAVANSTTGNRGQCTSNGKLEGMILSTLTGGTVER